MVNTLIFVAEKMWVAFALQKLLTFLQQNINALESTLDTTVIKFAINKLVKLTMLWTTGPSFFFCFFFYILIEN